MSTTTFDELDVEDGRHTGERPEPATKAAGESGKRLTKAGVLATAGAVAAICAAGALAIWYIHATTPRSPEPTARVSAGVTGGPATAGSRPTAPPPANGVGAAPEPGLRRSAGPDNDPLRALINDHSSPGARPASDVDRGSADRASSANSSSAIDGNASGGSSSIIGAMTAPSLPSGSMSWSPRDRVRESSVPAEARSIGAGGASAGPGAPPSNPALAAPSTSRPDQAPIMASSPVPSVGPANTGPKGTTPGNDAAAGTQPQTAVAATDPAAGASATASRADPAAEPAARPEVASAAGVDPGSGGAKPRSLAQLQQAECGNLSAVRRLFCGERVRLSYCSSRWNQHPDCVGAQPATP